MTLYKLYKVHAWRWNGSQSVIDEINSHWVREGIDKVYALKDGTLLVPPDSVPPGAMFVKKGQWLIIDLTEEYYSASYYVLSDCELKGHGYKEFDDLSPQHISQDCSGATIIA